MKVSVVIPAKNEADSLRTLLPSILEISLVYEVIVVDDGSTDNTAALSSEYPIRIVKHPYSKGNGAAIKSGANAAQSEVIVFLDGDGQHQPSDIEKLVAKYKQGFDLVVGARNRKSQASTLRMAANSFYNWFSTIIVGHRIFDLTSGFRVVNAAKFREFISLYPNGFSCPTTSTIAFFRAGYSVGYLPIEVKKRAGKSHIKPLQDGVKFLLIIFRVSTLYSPLKVFFPLSLMFSFLGIGYYIYTYFTQGRFTNMSALLISTSLIIFLIGLVSEQISNLMYRDK